MQPKVSIVYIRITIMPFINEFEVPAREYYIELNTPH
jgi:hypothetical protein